MLSLVFSFEKWIPPMSMPIAERKYISLSMLFCIDSGERMFEKIKAGDASMPTDIYLGAGLR